MSNGLVFEQDQEDQIQDTKKLNPVANCPIQNSKNDIDKSIKIRLHLFRPGYFFHNYDVSRLDEEGDNYFYNFSESVEKTFVAIKDSDESKELETKCPPESKKTDMMDGYFIPRSELTSLDGGSKEIVFKLANVGIEASKRENKAPDNSNNNWTRNKDGSFLLDEVFLRSYKQCESAPKKDMFSTYLTGLNVGYVYKINTNDPNDFEEYEVNEEGGLSLSGGEVTDYIEVNYGEEFWVCYSPIKWSYKFKAFMNNGTEKNEFMDKIICKGYQQRYKSFHAAFHISNTKQIETLQEKLEIFHENELAAEQANVGGNEVIIRKDMLVTLHDPIGLANDIYMHLEKEFIYHQANFESIPFGKNPKAIVERIINNDTTYPRYGEEDDNNRNDMFTLALSSYQLIYNNPEFIKQYCGETTRQRMVVSGGGYDAPNLTPSYSHETVLMNDDGGISKKLLKKTIGVFERKQQRELIRKLQDDLGSLLEDSYFDSKLIVFSHDECNESNNLIGKHALMQYMRLLGVDPHDVDRSFDLFEDQNKKEGRWNYLISSCFEACEESTNLNKILHRNLTISNPEAQIHSLIRYHVDKDGLVKSKKTSEFILSKSDVFLGHSLACLDSISKLKSFRKIPVTPFLFLVNKIEFEDVQKVFTTTKDGYVTISTDTKASIFAKGILDNTAIKNLGNGLDIFNFATKLNSHSLNPTLKAKVELSLEVINLSSKITGQFGSTGGYKVAVKGLSVAAAGINVTVSAWDAFNSFDANDKDAMWAHIGSSGAALMSLAAILFPSTIWAGPVGIIATVLTLGFAFLVLIFTDSELEAFFKNYIFSTLIPYKTEAKEQAWENNNRLYNAHYSLLENKASQFHSLKNFDQANSKLYDLFALGQIKVKAIKFDKPFRNINYNMRIARANTFSVNVGFNMFLQDKSQFSYDVYYLENGKVSDTNTNIKTNQSGVSIVKSNNTAPSINVVFDSKNKNWAVETNAVNTLLFTCRLSIADDKYFPLSFDGNTRYVGIKMSIYHYEGNKDGNRAWLKEAVTKVAIDTKERLQTGTDVKWLPAY